MFCIQFRPEFLNRIDENVIFNGLSKENLRGIVVLEAKRLESRLAEKSMKMIVTDEAQHEVQCSQNGCTEQQALIEPRGGAADGSHMKS